MQKSRKPLRLKYYNYSANGGYFLTICTKKREHFFGEIKNDKMYLSEYGHLAKKYWEEIPEHFDDVLLDVFVIMPNHIHGIIFLDNDISGYDPVENAYMRSLQTRTKEKIPLIIQNYKAVITRNGKKFFPHKNFAWQKSYHDRIIRNEKELQNIREYILNNPLNWALDEENKIFVTGKN